MSGQKPLSAKKSSQKAYSSPPSPVKTFETVSDDRDRVNGNQGFAKHTFSKIHLSDLNDVKACETQSQCVSNQTQRPPISLLAADTGSQNTHTAGEDKTSPKADITITQEDVSLMSTTLNRDTHTAPAHHQKPKTQKKSLKGKKHLSYHENAVRMPNADPALGAHNLRQKKKNMVTPTQKTLNSSGLAPHPIHTPATLMQPNPDKKQLSVPKKSTRCLPSVRNDKQQAWQILQDRLGYTFVTPLLLHNALIHPSAGGGDQFQRLEFLGDRVLALAIAHDLFKTFANASEGHLAKRLVACVKKEALLYVAQTLKLPELTTVGGPSISHARVHADVCEAVLGAVYLDGGFDAAHQVIQRLWRPFFDNADHDLPIDAKSLLQEQLQAEGFGLPIYTVVQRTGPSHAPEFTVQVHFNTPQGPRHYQGIAQSKRQAEQNAAWQACVWQKTQKMDT